MIFKKLFGSKRKQENIRRMEQIRKGQLKVENGLVAEKGKIVDFEVQDKLISIIIPIVRDDPHVMEAVEHIKLSTYQNFEIIVVDEGLERSAQRNIGIDRNFA